MNQVINTTQERIEIANKIIATFEPKRKFEIFVSEDSRRRKFFYLRWQDHRGQQIVRQWKCDPCNLYPPFDNLMGTGGTYINAISTLVRWCQGKNVYPLGTWKRWGGECVKMWRDEAEKEKAFSLFEQSDYPKEPICVFCGESLQGKRWDWYFFRQGKESGCGCMPSCERKKTS